MKHTDFIVQINGANSIDVGFLKDNGINLTMQEVMMLGSLEFFEKGEQIPNKNNEFTYLPSIGVALYEISEGARMFGAIEKSEIGKSMFKKFYPDKYDLFF